MDSKKFFKFYNLLDSRIMPHLPNIPIICCNKVCNHWSSPCYCYELYITGKEYYPVCVRSALLFNLKKLPVPKIVPIQLELFDL